MKIAVLAAALVLTPVAASAQGADAYVRQAGASDRFEIAEARMAQARSPDPRVRRAAQLMVRDHTRSTALVQAAVRRTTGHNPPAASLSADQAEEVAALRRAPRASFDRTYIDQQVQAHQQALSLHRAYAARGQDAELRRTAAMIAPVVQQHLDMWSDLRNRAR